MAFKMKGSAFKLNNVATKSALKHRGEKYAKENVVKHKGKWTQTVNPRAKRDHDQAHYDGTVDENHNPVEKKDPNKEELKTKAAEAALPMRNSVSALKHRVSNKGEFESGYNHNNQHYDPETKKRMNHDKDGNWTEATTPTKMKSPVKQLSSYTCPECQAVFELPEDLVEHMEEVHLSGDTGTGTPGSDYTGVKRNRGGGKKKKGLFRRR